MAKSRMERNFRATTATQFARIVKVGAADYDVVPAAAAADVPIGVVTQPGIVAINDRCDVALGGIAEVELGGTVARGNRLTSDASGRGVNAAPAAGTNNGVVGIALQSGVVGDIIEALIAPQSFQG